MVEKRYLFATKYYLSEKNLLRPFRDEILFIAKILLAKKYFIAKDGFRYETLLVTKNYSLL